MTGFVESDFDVVRDAIAETIGPLGFRKRSKNEWRTRTESPIQRVTVSLRKIRGQDAGFIEVFAGVNFPELEELSAEVQGQAVRKEFFTCSLNIGLLNPDPRRLEWLLATSVPTAETIRVIADELKRSLPPFLDDFLTLSQLMARYDRNDRRVCVGDDWRLKQAIVASVLGDHLRCEALLRAQIDEAAGSRKSMLEGALQRFRL